MTLAASATLLRAAAGLAALALSAWPAGAQIKETQPWQPPVPAAEAKPRTASSDLGAATQSATTPTQQREAKALTTAVFAKPAAKAKAAQKLDDANQPDRSAVSIKPEWTEDKAAVGVGGKGVQIKTPF